MAGWTLSTIGGPELPTLAAQIDDELLLCRGCLRPGPAARPAVADPGLDCARRPRWQPHGRRPRVHPPGSIASAGPDELARVSVAGGKIVSVECVQSLRWNGKELLGLGGDVNRLLPRPATLCEAYDDGDERWECEELGLMLWVEDGIVASATVSSPGDEAQ